MKIIDARKGQSSASLVSRSLPQLVGADVTKFRFMVTSMEPDEVRKSLNKSVNQFQHVIYLMTADLDTVRGAWQEILLKYQSDKRLKNANKHMHAPRTGAANKGVPDTLTIVLLRSCVSEVSERAITAARRRKKRKNIKDYDMIGEIVVQSLGSPESLDAFHALNGRIAAYCKSTGRRSLIHVAEYMLDASQTPNDIGAARVEIYGKTLASFDDLMPVLTHASGKLCGYLHVTRGRKVMIDQTFGVGAISYRAWHHRLYSRDATQKGDLVAMSFWAMAAQIADETKLDAFLSSKTEFHDIVEIVQGIVPTTTLPDPHLFANPNAATKDLCDTALIVGAGTWLCYHARFTFTPTRRKKVYENPQESQSTPVEQDVPSPSPSTEPDLTGVTIDFDTYGRTTDRPVNADGDGAGELQPDDAA